MTKLRIPPAPDAITYLVKCNAPGRDGQQNAANVEKLE